MKVIGFCRASLTQRTQWLAGGVLASAAALLTFTWVFAYPAGTPPGVASILGLVTAPNSSISLGSTSSFSTGDEIEFTSTFKAPAIKVPQWESHLVKFEAGQLYVKGSTKTPPGYTASYWVAGTKQAAEPATGAAVSQIEYTYTPSKVSISNAPVSYIDASGAGDGYEAQSFEGNIYLVNHHISGNFMKCYAATNTVAKPCTPQNSTSPVSWEGGRHGGDGIWTSNAPTAKINRDSSSPHYGKIYYAAYNAQVNSVGFGCYDLKKGNPCGFIAYDPFERTYYYRKYASIVGLGAIGNNIYAVKPSGEIMCLNTLTEQKCPTGNGENYRFSGGNFAWTAGGAVHDNNQPGRNPANPNYIFAVSGSSGGPVYCFNASTAQPCSGNWPARGLNGAGSIVQRITTNADSSFQSVCLMTLTTDTANCVDAQGNTVTMPTGLSTSISAWAHRLRTYVRDGTSYTTTPTANYPTARRRIYSMASNEEILCYDEDAQAACAGFSMNRARDTIMYTITPDAERPNCLWTDSDTGSAYSFDALTGGACAGAAGGKISMTVKPIDAYRCNPAEANITGWDAIVTSGASTAGLEVKIFDATTNTQIGGTLTFATGQSFLNISHIPYAANSHLRVDIQNNGSALVSGLVADVTWVGGPKQFCSKITAGADCVATATVLPSSTDDIAAGYTSWESKTTTLIKDQARAGFGAGSAVSSIDIRTKPLIFRGTFDEGTLSGDMTVARYGYDPKATPPTLGPGSDLALASQDSVTPADPADRHIITQLSPPAASPGAAIPITASVAFTWNTIDATQRDALSKPAPGAASALLDAGFGEKRLNYLRGADTDEVSQGGKLRNRTGTARSMGMVLGSSLVYLPTYGSMGYSETQQEGYSNFATGTGRKLPTVFVNANDGMLHAFKVDDQGGDSVTLSKQFAYMPRSLMGKMTEYTDKSQQSLSQSPYFNDNTPMVADVKLNNSDKNSWATVLASGFGRGAKGLYMLNVTQADTVTQANPKNLAIREFTQADDADMGYIVSQPTVNDLNLSSQIVQVKTDNGLRPAVIVGNGKDSANAKAALFIIYLDAAGGYVKIVMPATAIAGVTNGLSTPRVLTSTPRVHTLDGSSGVASRVYAGDLYGNMWVVDVSDVSNTSKSTPKLLFTTRLDAAGKPTPIATAPTALPFNPSEAGCANCFMVNFVTGKPTTGVLLYDSNIPQQTSYGVLDKGMGATVTMNLLVQQSLGVTTSQGSTVKDIKVDYKEPNILGWYMDLPAGQMAVANPFLRPNGTFVFFTIKQASANAGACAAGDGDVYEVKATDGNVQRQSIDINGDFKVDDNDLITVGSGTGSTKVAAATKSVGEAQRGPTQVVQLTPGSGLEVKVTSKGGSVVETSSSGGGPKRISWREIVN